MTTITGYQRPHFEVGAPSVLSRATPSLLRIVSLVAAVALVYFIYKAFAKDSSERELRAQEGEAAPPQDRSDLSREDCIRILVDLAETNAEDVEKTYLEWIKEGKLDTPSDLFQQLQKRNFLDEVHRICEINGVLYTAINAFKNQLPVASALPLNTPCHY